MQIVAQGQTVSAAYPAVHEYVIVSGVLTDVFAAEFRIYPVAADGVVGAQTYPAMGAQAVNLTTHRLGTGHYVAAWAVPAMLAVGYYKVVWAITVESGDTPIVLETVFEVVSKLSTRGPLYASVASMRAEGVATSVADYIVHAKLVGASRQFEMYTRRFFEPRYKALHVDGRGAPDLMFAEPIIGIESVQILESNFEPSSAIDPAGLRVYNRHITSGLMLPDDRESPRISWAANGEAQEPELTLDWYLWPRGKQNVYVKGVFGYTDWDDTATGMTPWAVSHAVRLMAIKDLPVLTDTSSREDARRRWALTGERTRDQQYSLLSGVDAASRAGVVGAITGDPEIDRIIVLYMRSAGIGAA